MPVHGHHGVAAGAGGAADAGDQPSTGVNACTLLIRYELSDPALDTRGAGGGARSLGWGATEVGRLVSPVPVVEGAVVVEAAATVAVDERDPARWPRLWVEEFEEKAVPVAGLPRSRFWWDVGSRQRELLVLGAAGLELDGVECSVDVLAVELWDCAPGGAGVRGAGAGSVRSGAARQRARGRRGAPRPRRATPAAVVQRPGHELAGWTSPRRQEIDNVHADILRDLADECR